MRRFAAVITLISAALVIGPGCGGGGGESEPDASETDASPEIKTSAGTLTIDEAYLTVGLELLLQEPIEPAVTVILKPKDAGDQLTQAEIEEILKVASDEVYAVGIQGTDISVSEASVAEIGPGGMIEGTPIEPGQIVALRFEPISAADFRARDFTMYWPDNPPIELKDLVVLGSQ